jgi:hypothetical protein
LVCCSIGTAKVIESGGVKVVLAAISNHLNQADVCECACLALMIIARNSKENTGYLSTKVELQAASQNRVAG